MSSLQGERKGWAMATQTMRRARFSVSLLVLSVFLGLAPELAAQGQTYVRGDSNSDGAVDLADPVGILSYLFSGGVVECERAGDANSDGAINIADAVHLLSFLFTGGAAPGQPFPLCGIAASPELSLGCDSSPCTAETIIDADGNQYSTVTIGEQVWATENLKVTRFNDGTPIDEYFFPEEWNEGGQTIPKFQYASTADLNDVFDSRLPFDYFGAIYNHAALESGLLAPPGWRLPTVADFEQLSAFIASQGHTDPVATVVTSTEGWHQWLPGVNQNGTDLYGLRILPNGYCTNLGSSAGVHTITSLATTDVTIGPGPTRQIVSIQGIDSEILFGSNSILLGSGVRLIKEAP